MLKAIWTQAIDGTFGIDNKIPWFVHCETGHFLSTVKDHIVVMGANTFRSLNKPIANCLNIVVSTTLSKQTPGVFVFDSVDEVLRVLDKDMPGRNIFLIGGSKLIEENIHRVDEFIVSVVPYTFTPSDNVIYAPEWDKSVWECYEQQAVAIHANGHGSGNVHTHYFRKKEPCRPNPNQEAPKAFLLDPNQFRPAAEKVLEAMEKAKSTVTKALPKVLDKLKSKSKRKK